MWVFGKSDLLNVQKAFWASPPGPQLSVPLQTEKNPPFMKSPTACSRALEKLTTPNL